jgi:hypothetical protein
MYYIVQRKLFSFYLSNKTYFYVLLSTNPKTLFLMEGVFIFKIQVHQNWKWGSPLYEHLFHLTNLFYKSSFTTISPVFKIAVMWRIPPWYYSVLKKKIMGILPKVYKSVFGYFLSKKSCLAMIILMQNFNIYIESIWLCNPTSSQIHQEILK